ncbi:MAG: (2Fe-2S) ferredoxin domain-containing protein [Rickettsiales bacterium]|nr:(2Fe-2S) ferredoxin domain-containing protein [Rickettsiales bacterium]
MPEGSFYQHHVFICDNRRETGHVRGCCAEKNAEELRDHLKTRVKDLKLNGKGKVRINKAGCLDRCELGPVLVIYPEECWYRATSKADIDEILQTHLIEGKIVERLKLARNQTF